MYTVLAVTAHPDDMEICCAGTLLKCKERGDRVVVCHLSNGDLGHVVIMPEELGKIRVEEAKRSGITDVLIITGRNKDCIEDYFDFSPEYEQKISAKRGDITLLRDSAFADMNISGRQLKTHTFIFLFQKQ